MVSRTVQQLMRTRVRRVIYLTYEMLLKAERLTSSSAAVDKVRVYARCYSVVQSLLRHIKLR